MRRALAALLLLFPAWSGAAFDADGVVLGAPEMHLKQAFPNAFCKALEWSSRAAERRCDDGKARFADIEARITFYLKSDAVEAFDVRFDSRDTEQVAAFLRKRYGRPVAEERSGKLTRLEWQDKAARAVLTSVADRRRASLLVYRGAFDEEIYKVR
jgi:hypothetical protein